MSAGDIIDRAARLYRRNFLAFLRIVFGPSLVAYLGTMMYYAGIRNFSTSRGDGRVLGSIALIVAGFGIWIAGKAAFYALLGGTSRSLVDHFFEGKPILARDAYRAVRQRFWSLIGAMLMVAVLLMGAGTVIYFVVIVVVLIGVAGAALLSGAPGWLQATLSIGFGVVVGLVMLFLFLLVYSRVVYLPQVMMVEGKGVFNGVSRSFSLAGRETWRIAALLLFWAYVAASVWIMFYIPLMFVGAWFGIDPTPFNQDVPFWFITAQQTISQVSEILIAPIAMLGFTLLYLDSRVRKEGFDVELLANRLIPATPRMIQQQAAPQQAAPQPAFFTPPATSQSAFPSILGLNDYAPIRQTTIDASPPTPPEQAPIPEQLPEPATAEIASAEVAAVSTETQPPILPETIPAQVEAEAAPAGVFQRTCHWCGTDAGGEDRFCRVCGSVF